MFCVKGGCGGEEQSGKEKENDEKTFCVFVLKHSVTHFHFDLLLNQIISITHPPIPPQKYLSLSLIVDEHTNTPPLTHIYHTNQQPSLFSPEFNSLPNSSFSFSKQHTQSPSLSQNNHFSCQSSNQFLPPFSLVHLIDSKM